MTTKKYFAVARMEAVGANCASGSRCGGAGVGASGCAMCHQIIAAMPAISRIMLTTVHIALPLVRVLPTSGSCGQLLVYESPCSPGRSVAADQADQKKNAAMARRSLGLGSALSGIAYCSRSRVSAGASPNSAS